MALAAHNPTDRAEQLITLTNRLTDLIERETRLFDARKPLEAAPFRDEKAKLANIYRQETARIAREPSLLKGIGDRLYTELRISTEKFHAALGAHQHAIGALQELTEGLVRSIATHIEQTRQLHQSYGPQATKVSARQGHGITMNQSA
jgi:hypothetical protein